jgi:hypothetical protein
MTPRSTLRRGGSLLRIAAFVAGFALAAAVPAGLSAQQWPVLKQGMWEFVRTIGAPGGGAGNTVTSKRCVDPTADMQRQNATLAKAGCTISAPARRGNIYTFTASCRMMGVTSDTTSTIALESDSAYTLTVEGMTGGAPTRETLKARRIGDCSR